METAAELLAAVSLAEPDHAAALAYYPDDKRAAGLALMAFAAEMRSVPLRVSEPMLGAIRLQWWREALDEVFGEGRVRAHPLVSALAVTLREAAHLNPPMLMMIDGTETFFSHADVTGAKAALDVAAVHDGGLAGGLVALLDPTAELEGWHKAGAAYGALRALVRAEPGGRTDIETPTARIARAPHAEQLRRELLAAFNAAWTAITPADQAVAPVAAALKSARTLGQGRRPGMLARRLMQFGTIARGK
ncbi:squalene/phytoene synthase family protein [Parvularcula sp. LCG005]|uniref:squalene/phytoene synthase family protein n=1 Tax=Parvularcula sp. LCG005 TaxID=3078805 RepID=UPI0029433DC2|nr:squalene/phytoene synthase family protein [Parvularcula sp. LCG005]WOI51999.1 squalene/phytoene synthase family protein [Parvularcula sp. LCG005]